MANLEDKARISTDAFFEREWIDGLIQFDCDGNIVRVNQLAESLLGWTASDLLGRPVHDALCGHSAYTDHSKEQCPLTVFSGPGTQPTEAYWVHKNQENVSISYRKAQSDSSHDTENSSGFIVFQTSERLGYNVSELKKLSAFTDINLATIQQVD